MGTIDPTDLGNKWIEYSKNATLPSWHSWGFSVSLLSEWGLAANEGCVHEKKRPTISSLQVNAAVQKALSSLKLSVLNAWFATKEGWGPGPRAKRIKKRATTTGS